MRRHQMILWAALLLVPAARPAAAAEWVNFSRGLDEVDIRSLAVDPKNASVIFAGSERRIYKTIDGGESWKRILAVRGENNKVRFIYADPFNPDTVYVATDRGVQKSQDGGKHWSLFFNGIGEKANSVHCIANGIQNPGVLWIGTSAGLFRVDTDENNSKKINDVPEAAVYSVFLDSAERGDILITTEKGIYRSLGAAGHWERVYTNEKDSLAEEKQTSLEQFEIEEFSAIPSFSNLVFLREQDKFFAATKSGILEGVKNGSSWSLMKGQTLPDQKINCVAKTPKTFYVCTDRGIFQWDWKSNSFREIYKGLESGEVHTISYNANGDYLIAGTKKGVFKLYYPELDLSALECPAGHSPQASDILNRFKNEPSILEIQSAAIRYAEVHPSKIESWRKAAALKAILPTVSVDHDMGRDQNIDIDRGGTADPDRFINGPEEKSFDWSVGMSWDLSELVWNNDQTSIDTRSRLLVELRDDVLTQITHLYYERRRLQVEMAMAPNRELPVQIEKEIRMQELTAGIDALTGGYLSKRLEEH